jgi:hypothetical protein
MKVCLSTVHDTQLYLYVVFQEERGIIILTVGKIEKYWVATVMKFFLEG